MRTTILGVVGVNTRGQFFIAAQGGPMNEAAKTRLAQIAIDAADKNSSPITAIYFRDIEIDLPDTSPREQRSA